MPNPNTLAADDAAKPKRVYFVCDSVEFMAYTGRAIAEDGTVLGTHTSTSRDWLRFDLGFYVKPYAEVPHIVDLLEEPVPERFALKGDE